MDSSRNRNVSKRSDPVNFPEKTLSSSRRSLSSSSSFSSCSSSSLMFPGDSPLNYPATPLHSVPFSWEDLPGKPKDYSQKLDNEFSNLLPLPPHRNIHFPTTEKTPKSNSFSKKNSFTVNVRDPFVAALLECSKEEGTNSDNEEDSGGSNKKLSKRSMREMFGLVNLYGSCRRTCAVSESLVYLPSSRKAASFDHLLLPRGRR